MADLDKVPGMRKNGEPVPPEDSIDAIPAEDLDNAINAEMAAWASQGLSPDGIQHNIHLMDVQILTIVHVLMEMGIINEDDFNERFRRRLLHKLTNLRSQITKQQITAGVPKPGIIIPGK